MSSNLLSIISAILAFGCFIPYGLDVWRGRAKPARSTRIMFTLLLALAFLQQQSLGSGLSLALTAGESLGSFAILLLAMRKGVGGLRRVDIICYGLLVADVAVWQATQSSLLALHLTIMADQIAVWPTLVKTWHDPKSETPLFFIVGAIAPLFAVAAENSLAYRLVLFPLYITAINTVMVLLIYRHELRRAVLYLSNEDPPQ